MRHTKKMQSYNFLIDLLIRAIVAVTEIRRRYNYKEMYITYLWQIYDLYYHLQI